MRVLFFNDLHGHRFQQFSVPVDKYGTNRIQRAVESLYWIASLVRESRPDVLLFGGDLLEDWRSTDWFVYNRIWEAWIEIVGACSETHTTAWAIPGNHDMFNLRLEDSAILPLGALGVRLFGRPQMADGVLLRPYEEHPSKWRQQRVRVGFAHLGVLELTIRGYAIGSVTVDDLGACRIYSGHYHIPSRWKGRESEIVYTGAIQARNFSDAGEHQFGASVIDTELDTETRYANPYAWSFLKVHASSLSELEALALKSRVYVNLTVEPELREHAQRWLGNVPPDMIVKLLGAQRPKSKKIEPTSERKGTTLQSYLQEKYGERAGRLQQIAEAIESGTFSTEERV
jgi:DNA repair exonuclease SbcCD nuclease subunit